jgi:1-acyl-sn-glycerol-3-phosphate acyltransferase
MSMLIRIIAWPLSALYYIAFGLTLVVFHVIQWCSLKLGGYSGHKQSVDLMNFFLNKCLNILGTRIEFINKVTIPDGVPLIIVSNHQSMYDISPISWHLRKYHPKFISKIELARGLPGISFNLRHGGSVLIDRKNPRQSLPALKAFAEYIEQHNYAAVLFPEGTRSKDGNPGQFAATGLQILCKNAPSAYILPVTINNAWKITRWGNFPLCPGVKIILKIHDPISVKSANFESLLAQTEQVIKENIHNH